MADAAEIENLVTITDTPPGQLLLDRAADDARSTWSLDTALHGPRPQPNPVLDEGMELLPVGSQPPAHTAESPRNPASASGHPVPRVPSRGLAQVPADSRPPASPGTLKRVSGDNQHYQPAALIGSFGRPAPSGRLREARIAVRRKATGAVDSGFPKAEKLA